MLLVGSLGVLAILITEAIEWAEALLGTASSRAGSAPSRCRSSSALPMVSLHLPIYNEPPEMVIETLEALARARLPELRSAGHRQQHQTIPVCGSPSRRTVPGLGPRFRFFHLDPVEGFKAGALNFALRQTDPDAEIVAVIDSDYVVRPDWLATWSRTSPTRRSASCRRRRITATGTRAPSRRCATGSTRGFFHIGMVTRNERNAIIQHGTMTLVRRAALEALGGWAEWCITEDAELGLRILEAGYETTYVERSYGRGLMPDTFIDYQEAALPLGLRRGADPEARTGDALRRGTRRQAHRRPALPLRRRLAALVRRRLQPAVQPGGARAGRSPWCVAPTKIDPPLMLFSVLPLSLFLFKLVKLLHLYRARVGATFTQTIAAAIAGLGLSHTVGSAMLSGFFNKDRPFFRTPKRTTRHAWLQSLAAAREEAVLMCGLWVAAFAVSSIPQMDGDKPGLVGSPDLTVWVTVLLVQSIPYAAAVVVSLVSSLQLRGDWIGEARDPVFDAAAAVEPDVVAVATGTTTLPVGTLPGNNGGALPATAKLDSAK